MSVFSFQTVPNLRFGESAAEALAPMVEGYGTRRLMLITDPGVVGAGLVGPVVAGLEARGLTVAIYDDVEADPPETKVLSAVKAARDFKAEAIVGFGGGSPMDTAKLVALLVRAQQPLREMYGVSQVDRSRVPGGRLPLFQVPTTAGTGSEVTPIAIVTVGAEMKLGVVDPVLYADGAVLDPRLTCGLPPHVTAHTGIDAMVHAIEAYTSRVRKNPISDNLAQQALKLLAGGLPRAMKDGSDLTARGDMLLGAMLAGQAFANAPVAAVHALAYPIGALFHVPHGLSNTQVLAPVLRFNAETSPALYADLAALLVPEAAEQTKSDTARAGTFIDFMVQLTADCGVDPSLRAVGISHNDLPKLAEDAMKQTRLLQNNPREMTYEAALAIYTAAL
ncbi:MAG: iron-containing alcohol dehydrogenase [Rhodospirillaceae bacterium]|nr:MAG: iron-containing alcohol dehydrogenase [Rhodospirillaceae bacterium]